MQFTRKTSSSKMVISLITKLLAIIIILTIAVFLLSKIDFPTPNKQIEKIIPNENFKIVK